MYYSLEHKKVDKESISCQTIDKQKRRGGGDLFQRVFQFLHEK